jgi:lipoate-protein ligase B
MLLVNLPTLDYGRALDLQKTILAARLSKTCPDVLLILEHPHTITLGVRGNPSDILISEQCLLSKGIALYYSDRGGEATYHGPGQVVCYPIIDLRSLRITVRNYVRKLEQTIIGGLARLGVHAFKEDRKTGVWTGANRKIASIGIRIMRRITYHGFSVNVDLQLDPSEFMVSCGMPQARMVSIRDVSSVDVSMESVRASLAESFAAEFQVRLEHCPTEEFLDRVCC